jgi:hypothetical protein
MKEALLPGEDWWPGRVSRSPADDDAGRAYAEWLSGTMIAELSSWEASCSGVVFGFCGKAGLDAMISCVGAKR